MIILKNKHEYSLLLESGKIVGEVLHQIRNVIKEGVTTKELNNLAEKIIIKHKGIPGFKGYRGFPYTICASVNDEVVHGFPNNIPLISGDIVTVDVGVLKNGYYGDAAVTYSVGKIPKSTKNLLTTTKECLYISIDKFTDSCQVGTIARTIQQNAENKGFSVVKEFGGHGVGKVLHEEPYIPNYGTNNVGITMLVGTSIAIEPILTEGSSKVYIREDGWTVVTCDGSLAAHFEHTVFLTENGPIILTVNE